MQPKIFSGVVVYSNTLGIQHKLTFLFWMVHAGGLTTSHTRNSDFDPWLFTLTHYGLVTSYGDMDVGKHWLR